MENQTNATSSKQIMLNYGLILGFVSILINVTNYAIGDIYKPNWSVQVIGILVTIVFIIMGLKKKKEANNGYLKIGESLKTGLGIILVGSVLGLAYTYVFMNFIEPDFMNNVMELQQQAMLENNPNLSDEQIEARLEMSKKFSGFGVIAIAGLIWALFLGFVISLIGGLVMKKTDEEITSI